MPNTILKTIPDLVAAQISKDARELKASSIEQIEEYLARKYFEYRRKLDENKATAQNNEIQYLDKIKEQKEVIIRLQKPTK